jgi:hypothetical protein
MFILVVIISLAPFHEEKITRVFQTGKECRQVEAQAIKAPNIKINRHCSMVI